MAGRRRQPYPRGKGAQRRWVAAPTAPDGKADYQGSFALKREAQDVMDAYYRALDERGSGAASRDTLGGYAETWTTRHSRSQRTNKTNISRIAAVLDVEIEGVALRHWRLRELRHRHVTDLIDVLLRSPWDDERSEERPGQARAAEGVRGILRTLSALTEDAIHDDRADKGINPFKEHRVLDSDARIIKLPKQDEFWTLEEMHEFAAAGRRHEPMLRLLADCGFRIGELLALQRELQNLRHGTFRVYGTAWRGRLVMSSREKRHDREGPIAPGALAMVRAMPVRIDSRWLFGTPGHSTVRAPRIDWPGHEELTAMLEAAGGYRQCARQLGVSDNALRKRIKSYEQGVVPGATQFTGGGKLWWYENFMRDVWEPACEASGMRPRPKEFRSSLNSILLAAGINRDDVAEMLGHGEDVNRERYTRALRRSGDLVREVVG